MAEFDRQGVSVQVGVTGSHCAGRSITYGSSVKIGVSRGVRAQVEITGFHCAGRSVQAGVPGSHCAIKRTEGSQHAGRSPTVSMYR